MNIFFPSHLFTSFATDATDDLLCQQRAGKNEQEIDAARAGKKEQEIDSNAATLLESNIGKKTFAELRAEFSKSQQQKRLGEATSFPSKEKRQHTHSKLFDQVYNYDSLKTPLLKFQLDNDGVSAGIIDAYIGLRANNKGKYIKFANDARRPMSTFPFVAQIAGGFVMQEQVEPILRHTLITYGLAPIPGYFPSSQIYGIEDTTPWQANIKDPMYSLPEKLLAAVIHKLPEITLESPDRDVIQGQPPDLVSENPHVTRLIQSMQNLEEHWPTENQINDTNSRFYVNVLVISSHNMLTNHSRHSHHFPKKYMRPPENDFGRLAEQELKHFHRGRVSEYGLTQTVDVPKFRLVCQKNKGLAQYIMYKRGFSRTNKGFAQIFKTLGSKVAEARERGLFSLCRHNYNRSTPANSLHRIYGLLPEQIRKHNVFSCPVLWQQGGNNGILVNYVLVLWPLLLASYVNTLTTQEERDQWYDIFVGDTITVLADMVQFLGWEKLGYPIVLPINKSKKPKLLIGQYTPGIMKQVNVKKYLHINTACNQWHSSSYYSRRRQGVSHSTGSA